MSNILGEIILSNNNFSGNTIDLEFLENGIYFINISTIKGIHIEKIILSK